MMFISENVKDLRIMEDFFCLFVRESAQYFGHFSVCYVNITGW
jgi:hypothetical protein